MTFVAYVRVSTARQGERGVSLQEQREAIERYAIRHDLNIARWFEERETAAKLGRKEWAEMLRLLRRGTARGVLIHKIDRSARNLRDWADLGDLIDRGVEVRFVNESLDLQTRSGRLSADIQAVVAADYIRNLREEALKGIQGRLKQGILPLPAPVGYLDRGAGRPKAIDPEKGPLVRRAFELYATGRYNLHALRDELSAAGLRNRRGGEVTVGGLAKLLRNPFYTGLIRIRRRKEVYEGAHEPLLPQRLFDRVQAVLDGKLAARPERHEFLFRRRLRCGTCRYALIGERQKGLVYYRCHTRSCPTTSARETAVEARLSPLLVALQLDPGERAYLGEKVAGLKAGAKDSATAERRTLELQLRQLAAKRSRLADALVDGVFDRELFEERQEALLKTKRVIEDRLAGHDDNGAARAEQLADFLERLDTANSLYESGTTEERRQLLDCLTSNWTVTGKAVDFTPLPEVQLVAERAKNTYGGAYRVRPRTWEKLIDKLAKLLVAKSEVQGLVIFRCHQTYSTGHACHETV